MRAARYLRVSRVDQDPKLQEDETADFVTRRGWKLSNTYVDHGVSGSRERRPELDRLLQDARRRRFDLLVVYRADRLFRSMKHMVMTLDDLASWGIGFVSVTEPFDSTSSSGKLLIHLVSAMAEFERSILIERTKSGMSAARRRGSRIGRPPARIDLDRVAELRAEGRTLREVARELGVGAATIHRAMASDPKGPSREPS
jgi:DNA invertase Pin-like site-specific DNA recombinase